MSNDTCNSMVSAAEAALTRYLQVQETEKVLLISDETTEDIAAAFRKAAENTSVNLTCRHIELTGGHGRNPDAETVAMMLTFDVIIAPARYSLTHCAATHAAAKAGARVATLPGITNDIFLRGLQIDPLTLKTAGDAWIKALNGNCTLHVTSPAGTDVTLKVGKYPVINDDGCIFHAGIIGNLPAGEAFFAPDPDCANGTIVMDGTIGSQDWSPDAEPATLYLENGYLVKADGTRGKALFDTLSANGQKGLFLAEMGIGSNPDLKMGGNMLEDEKVKGTIHFAFGNNCGFGGSNSVPVHIDGLVVAPTVVCDGKELMKDGEWLV